MILGGKIADSRIEPTIVTFGQVAVLLFGFSTSLFICASEFLMQANEFDVFSIPESYRKLLKDDCKRRQEDWTKFEDGQTEKCRHNERIGRRFYNSAIFTIFIGLFFAIAPYNETTAVMVSAVGIILESWQLLRHLHDKAQNNDQHND